MANSEVEIVNSGLVKIGESRITSLDQDTEAARVANVQYPILRDKLLREYRWNFSIKRETLALDATSPGFGFPHQFRLSVDCLRVLGVYDDTERLENYTSSRVQWKVENSNDELRLLTTESVTQVFYIARVTNVALFDSQFAEVLSVDCGIDWAYTLSTGLDRLRGLKDERVELIRQAKRTDAIEGKPEVIEATDWVDSRYGFGSEFGPRNRNTF